MQQAPKKEKMVMYFKPYMDRDEYTICYRELRTMYIICFF